MVSRRYNTYKFLYISDNGNNYVKRQREYRESVTDRVLTPITSTFLTSIIIDNIKVDSYQFNMRHTISYINVVDNPNNQVGEFVSYLPFPPTDGRLKNNIIEIQSLERVLCVDYVGEDNTYVNGN